MPLLNECSSTWYATLPACIDQFTVKMPMQNTILHVFFTDKFDHVYHEEVETDANGVFEIRSSLFPDGFFNPYIGPLIMEVKLGMGYCDPVPIEACGEEYDQVCIQFKDGDFSTQIPCEC